MFQKSRKRHVRSCSEYCENHGSILFILGESYTNLEIFEFGVCTMC